MEMVSKWFVQVILLYVSLCTSAWAWKCHYDFYCQDARIGLGGYYAHFTSPSVSTHNGGGFLTLQEHMHWKWFYLGIDAYSGIGGSSLSGVASGSGMYEKVSDRNWFFTFVTNIGMNFGSLEKPTFLYLTLSPEWYDIGFEKDRGRFINGMLLFGLGTFNRTMLTDKIGLESRANVAWDVTRRLVGYGYNVRSDQVVGAFDGSYKVELALGIVYRGNAYNGVEDVGKVLTSARRFEIPDFYAKIKGIYYHTKGLNVPYLETQTLRYPTTDNFVFMLEFGIGLNAPFI